MPEPAHVCPESPTYPEVSGLPLTRLAALAPYTIPAQITSTRKQQGWSLPHCT
jgi:hypothetical protein